jgi:hypothetical protein
LYFSLFEDADEFFENERDEIEKYVELNYLLDLWKHYEFETRYQFNIARYLLYVLHLPLGQVAKEF